MKYIKNAKVVLKTGILWDGAVLIEDNLIKAVGKEKDIPVPENAEIIDAKGLYVGPGFVDIHVHGGNGYMFSHNPIEASEHFLAHGETTVLATLYTRLNKENFLRAIDLIKDAMKTDTAAKIIAGFYMEGPYRNIKYGSSPELDTWRGEIKKEDYTELVDRAGSDALVWAIPPEREGTEPFIQYAKKVNPDAKVAVCHSEATPAQIEKFKKYGLNILTHAMDATGRITEWKGTRGAGPDEACMADPEMYAEIISDSLAVHVCPELQRLLVKIKGIDKIILVTDSFVTSFPTPEGFEHIKDISFDANKGLSGSKLTLDVACKNFMQHTNSGIAQTFLAASTNPAKAVGIDNEVGSIEVGKKANLVIVDDMFNVKTVIFEGRIC